MEMGENRVQGRTGFLLEKEGTGGGGGVGDVPGGDEEGDVPGGDEARDEDAAPERVSSKTLAPERVSSKTLAPERITSKTLAQERVSSSPADLASAAANRLTFAIGVAAHFAFRPGLARVNRYDTSPPKRFLTLLALRLAVFADATTTNGERRVAMFDAMEACLSNERENPRWCVSRRVRDGARGASSRG